MNNLPNELVNKIVMMGRTTYPYIDEMNLINSNMDARSVLVRLLNGKTVNCASKYLDCSYPHNCFWNLDSGQKYLKMVKYLGDWEANYMSPDMYFYTPTDGGYLLINLTLHKYICTTPVNQSQSCLVYEIPHQARLFESSRRAMNYECIRDIGTDFVVEKLDRHVHKYKESIHHPIYIG